MLIRIMAVSMGLAAQPDIAQIVREARVETARNRVEQARGLLEAAVPRCEKNGKRQSTDCIQLMLDLSELVIDPAPLLARASEADADGAAGAEAAMRRGFVLVRRKSFDDAMTSFLLAERRDSRQAARSGMWLAITKSRSGKHDEALRQIEAALSKAEGAQAAVVAKVAAMLYEEMGHIEEAEAMRKRAIPVAPAPRPAPPEGALRVGGGVSAPSIVERFEPRYTEEARTAKYQGTVVLALVVGETGVPRDLRVVRGLGMGLDERALAAVAEWRFKPGMKDGVGVPVFATIEVKFRLL